MLALVKFQNVFLHKTKTMDKLIFTQWQISLESKDRRTLDSRARQMSERIDCRADAGNGGKEDAAGREGLSGSETVAGKKTLNECERVCRSCDTPSLPSQLL